MPEIHGGGWGGAGPSPPFKSTQIIIIGCFLKHKVTTFAEKRVCICIRIFPKVNSSCENIAVSWDDSPSFHCM